MYDAPRTMKRTLLRPLAWSLVVAGIGVVGLGLFRLFDRPPKPPRPVPRQAGRSLLLLTLDTTRADHLEPYGAENVQTPHLARLAAAGITFERAFSVAPITLVAHTSILTGLSPPAHGVRNNGIHHVPDSVETLAERLGEAGYATAAFVSAAVLERRYNLGQGFDLYDDDLSTGRERHPRMVADRPAEATVDAARAWLDAQVSEGGDRPFFLWVHLYDPHAAYSPPPPFRDTFRERLYDGEIAYMDSEIGRLLAHPRLREGVIIAALGDHGESLGEHGEQTHALLAYDATLRVPFLLAVPGGPRGLRLRSAVGQVDVVPTLLELLDLNVPRGLSGISLVPLLEGRAEAAEGASRRTLYSETYLPFYTYGWAKLRVLRQGRLKWIDAPTPELYDTERDPRELANLATRQPGMAHDLGRDLAEYLESQGEGERQTALTLDSETRERLESLGYLARGSGSRGGEEGEDEDHPRPDPKDVIDLHVGLEKARFFVRDRLFEQAEGELRRVLSRDPANLAALVDLASVLAEQGEVDEAIRITERALNLDPDYGRLYLQMASLEARRGNGDKALELIDTVLALDPRAVEARLRKAALLSRLGRPLQAVRVMEETLAESPDSPQVLAFHAQLVEMRRGEWAGAEERLREALRRDPFLVLAWRLLGEVLERSGRPEEALAPYREGLRREPDDPDLHAQLGLVLARLRQSRDAEIHLREALRLSFEPRLDLRVSLGAALAEQGRFEEAQAEYDQVLAQRPRDAGALNNRAVALYQTGRLAEARADLLALVEAHPRHVDAHNNLAAIAVHQGLFAEAEAHARATLELAPDTPEAWNNLGLAEAGQGSTGEARQAYAKALELLPGYWQARLNLGLLLADHGEPREAAETLEEALRQQPQLPDAHLALGRLYAGPLADSQRARTHYNAFLRQAPVHPEVAAVRRRLAELER